MLRRLFCAEKRQQGALPSLPTAADNAVISSNFERKRESHLNFNSMSEAHSFCAKRGSWERSSAMKFYYKVFLPSLAFFTEISRLCLTQEAKFARKK